MIKYLDPRNDLVFKKIFGKHPDLTMSFLNALMPFSADNEIREIQYLTSEMVPTSVLQRRNSIVDVRCTDNFGRQFIVEMQMYWTTGFVKRILFNAAKAYTRQEFASGIYVELKNVYTLAITDSIFDKETEEFYHRYEIVNQKNPKEKIDEMEFIFVELPKFKPQSTMEKKMAVLWLRFLKETKGENKIDPELDENPEIHKALTLCQEGAFTKEELYAYEAYLDAIRVEQTFVYEMKAESKAEGRAEGKAEGRAEGRAEGKAEGRAEGETKKTTEFVLNCYYKGYTIEQIADIVNLEKEEVIKIIEQNEP